MDDDMSTPCASDEFLHIDEYESDTIINFTKRIAAIGVTMQRISLPSISDFSLEQFRYLHRHCEKWNICSQEFVSWKHEMTIK